MGKVKYDLKVGDRFNRWNIIKTNAKHKTRRGKHYLCECECGSQLIISGHQLCKNRTQGCRKCMCASKKNYSLEPVYGKWTTSDNFKVINKVLHCKCTCACGYKNFINCANLRSGRSTQCIKCLGQQNSKRNALSTTID